MPSTSPCPAPKLPFRAAVLNTRCPSLQTEVSHKRGLSPCSQVLINLLHASAGAGKKVVVYVCHVLHHFKADTHDSKHVIPPEEALFHSEGYRDPRLPRYVTIPGTHRKKGSESGSNVFPVAFSVVA